MGAPESNAGDDYHFWWAASRALALIAPGADSRLVVVEGLARIDDPDDEYEIVDVAEYFGGVDFASASTVLLSQLKYSTRHPDRAWTAARLASRRHRTSTSRSVSRSVITDLVRTYLQLVADHDRDAVAEKVQIRLVSNQPGDVPLLESVAAAGAWVREHRASPTRAALLAALPPDHAAIIRQISDAIGSALSSQGFCDFLSVLDLSQTGSLDRSTLARGVRADLAEMSRHARDSSLRLFDLVRREALPDSSRRGLTAADVLAELGVASQEDLYPAPALLVEITDPLPAPGARAVADAIGRHPGGYIIAHGDAGAGKTTAVQQLAEHLPSGSQVLVYDCFGAGDYLSSGEERHPPQRFVMQVCNQLAQACGTPLLLDAPTLEQDLWRALSQRIAKATATLADDAFLVLAVDAADNAAVAAAERSSTSFLPGLLGLPLPAQVVVVLTARSHRTGRLGASGAHEVRIEPFDAATSAANLRRHRTESTEADGAAFHERTAGNPRVQFYVLEQAETLGWDLPALLDACQATPIPFFKDLVDSALRGSGADRTGQRWLATLLALARPVSMSTLADALDVDSATVSAFAGGLTPGVAVVDGAIRFRDEDFETYVRDSVDDADVVRAHGKLADLFIDLRATDADAAAHVADHLHAAGRHDEVLRLVLAEDAPQGIADGFRREQVQGRRLDLALLAAIETNDAAAAVRIAARGCQSTSRVDALSRMVETHLDLVALYADVDLLRSYALAQSRDGWLGPIYMRLAAALSRDASRHKWAADSLKSADAWLRRWITGPEEETRHWSIDAEDVASAAEAVFRLDGVEATVRWLRRWRPSFVLTVAGELAARVSAELEPDTLREALERAAVPLIAHAPFLAYTTSPGRAAPQDWIDAVVAAVVGPNPPPVQPWHARFLDTVIRHGSRDAAASLSSRWARDLPGLASAFSRRTSEGTTALRFHAAAAALTGSDLDIHSLVPTSLQPRQTAHGSMDDPRKRDREEWTSKVEAIGAIAVLAARAAGGDSVSTDVAAAVEAALTARRDQATHRWFKFDRTYFGWAPIAVEAVADSGAPEELLAQVADAAPGLVRDDAPELWLDLAEVLATRATHADRAAELCWRAAETAASGPYSAPDRLDLLARAATVAHSLSPALGRQLFDRALTAAAGINDDAARLLSVYATLVGGATVTPDQRAEIADRLIRGAEELAKHVTDEDVMPYPAVAGAATRLDAAVGLAAVSRWDDEARTRMTSTLPAALLGAVDGGGIRASDAMALDHLVEDDGTRLSLQLALVDRLSAGATGTPAIRSGVARAARWLRCHVPAKDQPHLARRLLDARGGALLDQGVRSELEAISALSSTTETQGPPLWRATSRGEAATAAQGLLTAASTRTWRTLGEDVALLSGAHVYEEQLRSFVDAVLRSTPTAERCDALAAVVAIGDWPAADTLLRLLADSLTRWHNWPGLNEWSAAALPDLLARHLPQLVAWRDDPEVLISQLRSFGDDDLIRHAILLALPEVRPRLTARGWHNVAMALSLLCTPDDAAAALIGLLADGHLPDSPSERAWDDATRAFEPLPMMLWSALGHPRRSVRWRATHAVRDLLLGDDGVRGREVAAEFIRFLDLPDTGPYRAHGLHFYRLSAGAMLLTALARVAAERPDRLRPHAGELIRVATSRDLPHAQIRELARAASLACAPPGLLSEDLLRANQPAGRLAGTMHDFNERQVSDERRYDFDVVDTIPYWYAPLARVFDLPVDAVAERAERWILDEWHLGEDDWMADVRELRDERSWDRMSHRQGSIPPEENLRLYLELHALLAAAGEFIDDGRAVTEAEWGTGDAWANWLPRHLPSSTSTWLADLRTPVPVHAPLFGQLPALEEWETPSDAEFDSYLALETDELPASAVVAAHTEVTRRGGRGSTYVFSALVAPDHAQDLQRALAAAADPRDFKLPDEDEAQFEIEHGRFILRGWLSDPDGGDNGLDEHDPYAAGMRKSLPLPGRLFQHTQSASPGPSGLTLRADDGATLATAFQWADPDAGRERSVTSSGYRVTVERQALLSFLEATGNNLIVEVQIGRHRSDASGYRTPRSRIYLVDATGRVTVR